MEMKDVSFLIGSGFSAPAGYPTASDLNEKLSKIDASEIAIHPDCRARFLMGENDPNAHRAKERQFVQEFLKFYCDFELPLGNSFDYEDFYDYYRSSLHEENYSDKSVSFPGRLQKKTSNGNA